MWIILKFLEVLFGKFRTKDARALGDEALIAQYLATQDEHLFSILYDRYSAKIYFKCMSMLKNIEAAQDCTQDIFIKVLTNISRFNQQSRFSTWLFSITYNHCIDLIRKNKKTIFVDKEADIADSTPEVSDAFLMETKVKKLKTVLDKMDDGEKTILLMKYQDELSIKEMCDITNKGESAMKIKIKRAKFKFKSIHDELYANDSDENTTNYN